MSLCRGIFLVFIIIFILPPGGGSASESVLVGFNVPLSGPYSLQGEDQLKAFLMGVDTLNDRGGILGQRVTYTIRDTATNPEKARLNAQEMIDEGARMITGGSSSAVAIAQAAVCQENKILCLAALSHSNATTGSGGHRYSFRWYNNGHQTSRAMAHTLSERFGPGTRYAFLYADYTWGRTVQKSMEEVITSSGGETVLNLATPLGAPTFISSLLQVKKARPDVLVMIHFGNDMVVSLKQATLLGLREKMKIVVPLMELHMAEPLGPEIMQGILTSMPWYQGLSKQFAGSKKFVEMFESRYHQKPGNSAATAWVNLQQYAEAVENAGSFDGPAVIRALEDHRFTLLGDEEYWRGWDHQGIHPTYVAVGKSPQMSRNKWDLFTILSEHKGENLARTREENPIQLEALEEER